MRIHWRRLVQLICALVCLAVPAGAAGTASAHQIALGAYIPGAEWHPGLIERYGRRTGRNPAIVSLYKPWTAQPFTARALTNVWKAGAVPMVTWEPWSWAGGRRFPLRGIAAGRFDGRVRSAARAAGRWGRPILLRFAHEMNGGWYPWGRRRGNTAAVYKRAWRHLVRIFRQEGASNVKWVWTPNVDNHGKYPFRQFFPGNRWVDWVGLDGFNWGARRREWSSFDQVFGSSYRELCRLTKRPMIIAEVGSSGRGGNKSAWLSRALRVEIPRLRRIQAVVWFDEPFNGIDPRVDGSPGVLRAFRAAARSPRYATGRAALAPVRLHFKSSGASG